MTIRREHVITKTGTANHLGPGREDHWTKTVLDTAAWNKWPAEHMYHVPDSRGMAAGWPDWTFTRLIPAARTLFVELKGTKTVLHREQADCLLALQACGFEVAVWRPEDFEEYVLPVLEGAPMPRLVIEPDVLDKLPRRKRETRAGAGRRRGHQSRSVPGPAR